MNNTNNRTTNRGTPPIPAKQWLRLRLLVYFLTVTIPFGIFLFANWQLTSTNNFTYTHNSWDWLYILSVLTVNMLFALALHVIFWFFFHKKQQTQKLLLIIPAILWLMLLGVQWSANQKFGKTDIWYGLGSKYIQIGIHKYSYAEIDSAELDADICSDCRTYTPHLTITLKNKSKTHLSFKDFSRLDTLTQQCPDLLYLIEQLTDNNIKTNKSEAFDTALNYCIQAGQEEETRSLLLSLEDEDLVKVTFDSTEVKAEVAHSEKAKQTGLMHISDLPANEGMLFIYNQPHKGGFWMKNTLIPLDIIFINQDLQVVDIKKSFTPCPPETEQCPTYQPVVKYHFALEVNGGFSDTHNIQIGDIIQVTNTAPDNAH